MRELQADEEIAVGVRAEALAVRGDERLAQRRRSPAASAASSTQLIGIGAAVVLHGDRLAAPDQLRAAERRNALPAPARQVARLAVGACRPSLPSAGCRTGCRRGRRRARTAAPAATASAPSTASSNAREAPQAADGGGRRPLFCRDATRGVAGIQVSISSGCAIVAAEHFRRAHQARRAPEPPGRRASRRSSARARSGPPMRNAVDSASAAAASAVITLAPRTPSAGCPLRGSIDVAVAAAVDLDELLAGAARADRAVLDPEPADAPAAPAAAAGPPASRAPCRRSPARCCDRPTGARAARRAPAAASPSDRARSPCRSRRSSLPLRRGRNAQSAPPRRGPDVSHADDRARVGDLLARSAARPSSRQETPSSG